MGEVVEEAPGAEEYPVDGEMVKEEEVAEAEVVGAEAEAEAGMVTGTTKAQVLSLRAKTSTS